MLACHKQVSVALCWVELLRTVQEPIWRHQLQTQLRIQQVVKSRRFVRTYVCHLLAGAIVFCRSSTRLDSTRLSIIRKLASAWQSFLYFQMLWDWDAREKTRLFNFNVDAWSFRRRAESSLIWLANMIFYYLYSCNLATHELLNLRCINCVLGLGKSGQIEKQKQDCS